MTDIDRSGYIERFAPYIGSPNAKVITGIRRCGKSTLLQHLTSDASSADDSNTIIIDTESWENRGLRDPNSLYYHIKGELKSGCRNILIIHEVQNVQEWESVIRSLVAEKCCDIYLTGSTADLLSSEYATFLTGRMHRLNMFPLSFGECIEFEKEYGDYVDNNQVFEKYIRFGGFPAIWRYGYETSNMYSALLDIYNTIIVQDIIRRKKTVNVEILDRMMRFFCDNIGKYTYLMDVYNALRTEGVKLGKDTVYAYAGYLEEACLICRVPVYSIKRKWTLSSKHKYFVTDLGMKNALSGYRPEDAQGYMENLLYLEFRSRGYNVWVGDYEGKEIDIVADMFGEKVYVQAVPELLSEGVCEREFGNLRAIEDNYPKYVVTLHGGITDGNSRGIICCGIREFLLKEKF